MAKKLVVLTVIFAVFCFAGLGCFRRGVHGEVHEGPYYDGPYRIDGGSYYYYNGGFTSMIAVRSDLIITFRRPSEDIMRSATAKIVNSIIAIILSGEINIRNTPGHPRDRKIGANET